MAGVPLAKLIYLLSDQGLSKLTFSKNQIIKLRGDLSSKIKTSQGFIVFKDELNLIKSIFHMSMHSQLNLQILFQ